MTFNPMFQINDLTWSLDVSRKSIGYTSVFGFGQYQQKTNIFTKLNTTFSKNYLVNITSIEGKIKLKLEHSSKSKRLI